MLKVGITGQAGFVGTHLYHLLGLEEGVERVPFEDAYFSDEAKLRAFVRECDAIVHLAAMNRDPDPQVIYQTNLRLVRQLIDAMRAEGVTPHVLFSSSIQEDLDNPYGASKREGRELFAAWARETGARFTACVLPNVFGPFSRPNYNTFVATFCHRLTHGEEPEVKVDNAVPLIYVGDVCKRMIGILKKTGDGEERVRTIRFEPGAVRKVTEILAELVRFRDQYFKKGIIPELPTAFDVQLFNTFFSFIDHERFFPFPLEPHSDPRGTFVETMKLDHIGGQVSFSTTVPGITRGNHYHTRKIERFAVIKGKARIELRRIGTDKVLSFELDGARPSFVDMPVWYSHNITNTGNEDLYTLFWINEFYDPADGDTFFEKVREER